MASAISAGSATVRGVTASLPVPTEPTSDLVSLRQFASLVPMPESTAREWHRAGRIKATRTATNRLRVSKSQLRAVREMLGLPTEPASEPAPAPEPAPETEA